MPEIKHNFSSGKMNKDLDERIVPNGEYRDALNIRVSTSDASDVGAVNNILSNRKITIDRNFTLKSNAKCVGAISDEKYNTFYWFIWNGNESDIILKIQTNTLAVTPVLVDKNKNVLKFNPSRLITGINIIDDLLFWTDGVYEPKKINIKNCVIGTSNFVSHTKLHNPAIDTNLNDPPFTDSTVDIIEEHVTVVKRAPRRAPSLELTQLDNLNQPGVIKKFKFADSSGVLWGPGNYPGSQSTIDGPLSLNPTSPLDINFVIFNSSASQEYDLIPNQTIIHLKSVKNNEIGFDADGDDLIDSLKASFNQDYAYSPDYDIRLKITSVSISQSQAPDGFNQLSGYKDVHAEILSIAPNTTIDSSAWAVNFEQAADPLFENKFPRFAYRYKYLDGEYSPFSPFTNTAFSPFVYSFDSIAGYNLGMRNYLSKVTLKDFITKDYDIFGQIITKKISHDVVGVDLLYKESNSPEVYVVDSLEPKDAEWNILTSGGAAQGEYSITSDTILKLLPSNQLLRSFDSVPLSSISQEIIGNRLVYGNYTQNIDINSDPLDIAFSYKNTGVNIVDEVAIPSIKTLRNYQLGIVYEDKYGRQTPVLTNKSLSLNVPITESTSQIKFSAKVDSTMPIKAETFKFFIKETSTEYYNLALSRWYDASDGNIWCSFNSADRNKVDEESYLYLKKSHGGDTAIWNPSKYKVLAIENEAPDYIKKSNKILDNILYDANSSDPIFPDYTFFPIKNRNSFKLSATTVDSTGFASISEKENLEMLLTQPDEANQSEVYRISTAALDPTNPSVYIVTIDGTFGDDVDFIESSTSTATLPVIDDGVFIKITDGGPENKPEFDGKFFVKINKDFNFTTHVLRESNSIDDMTIVHQEPLRYYDQDVLAATNDHFSADGGNDFDIQGMLPGGGGGGPSGNANYISSANRAATLFGDGTSDDTLDATGPKWFIDGLNHEGEPEFDSSNFLQINDNPFPPGLSPSIPGRSFGDNQDSIDISFSGILSPGPLNYNQTDPWDYHWNVGQEGNPLHSKERDFVQRLVAGSKFYYSSDPDKKIFTITSVEVTKLFNFADGNQSSGLDPSKIPYAGGNISTADSRLWMQPYNRRIRYRIFLDDTNAGTNVGIAGGTSLSQALSQTVTLNFVENRSRKLGSTTTSKNPAVFETKPKNNDNLEIYHEASESYDRTRHGQPIDLEWFNCYIFGNGVESNRIQDDFNAPFIDNGPKVSSTFEGEYKNERVANRLIFSGIYNSKNSVNRTNEFILGEKITKDLNPSYGSVQKLYTRNSDLVVLCEDKILRVLANKDAVFNADGNPQLIANQNVLGQTIPFAGEYGISTNPESFAKEGYRAYFTDKQRGVVLRLSMDGLTPISGYGMSDYFKDNLNSNTILGGYDHYNKEYNVTFNNTTVSFDEKTNGWVSFKSFVPEFSLTCANRYYSFKNGEVYLHDTASITNPYNNFYGDNYESSITFLLNDAPEVVKNFKTLNYEGTQARVVENTDDKNYYNLQDKLGWYAESVITDLESGSVNEFIKKEGKWFNNIKGASETTISTNRFNFQGIGSTVNLSTPPLNTSSLSAPTLQAHIEPDTYPDENPLTWRFIIPTSYPFPPDDYELDLEVPLTTGTFGSAYPLSNFADLVFDSNGVADVITPTPSDPYANGNTSLTATFYWRDSQGQILYQETVTETLTIVIGCADPLALNTLPGANMNDGSCSYNAHVLPQLAMGSQFISSFSPTGNVFINQYNIYLEGLNTFSAWALDASHEPYEYSLEWANDSGTTDETLANDWNAGGWSTSPPSSLTAQFSNPGVINNIMNTNSDFTSPVTNGFSGPINSIYGNNVITANLISVSSADGDRYFGFRLKFECQQPGDPIEYSNEVTLQLSANN
tara:strand:- start:7158 stop:12776 length:5619 start_codon:yes stop_codon:yes gene_type:complete